MENHVPVLLSHRGIHIFILVMQRQVHREAVHVTSFVSAPMETNQVPWRNCLGAHTGFSAHTKWVRHLSHIVHVGGKNLIWDAHLPTFSVSLAWWRIGSTTGRRRLGFHNRYLESMQNEHWLTLQRLVHKSGNFWSDFLRYHNALHSGAISACGKMSGLPMVVVVVVVGGVVSPEHALVNSSSRAIIPVAAALRGAVYYIDTVSRETWYISVTVAAR